jgi:hypothetical protein
MASSPLLQQNLPEDDGVVVQLVVRGVDKRNRALQRHIAQTVEFVAMLIDLFRISPPELLPTDGIVPKPFPQLSAWARSFAQ